MQTFSETSIAERFISRSSLIYVQEGDRHVKALKLKVGDQNTSRPNTVVSDLWKFELISKAWQSPRIWSCRCRACTWGSWRTHRRLPLSLAWTLTWNLAPPSPFPIVQVFQFLRSIFNPNYLSVSDHVCTTFGKIQVQLCSLLFFLRAPPYFKIGFVLSPLRKVHPSTLVPAGEMQTYVTLQPLLHSHSTSHRTASFISTLCNTSSFTFILCPEVMKDSQSC